MKTKKTLILLLCFLFKFISSEDVCSLTFCSFTGPEVRFPFRLVDRQPSSCGFPGFDLSCNEKNQTILKLPSSRSLIVIHISYATQAITVDPDFCGPERLVGVKLAGTPFRNSLSKGYTFYNCSSPNASSNVLMISFPCLESVNHSVYALERLMTSYGHIPESCKDIAMISVPVLRNYGGIIRSILGWSMPFCETCELAGGACAFKDGETTCIGSSHEGDSRRTTYSIIIFTSVPTVICAIMFLCCILGTVRSNDQGQHQSIGLSAIAITPQTRSTTGLDRTTIESYPKTILGESCEIPEDDSACAICLSDYMPKEVVRTIPECSHYFHVDCIDEWLKLNATCPVCRKLSQGSLLVTSCSSTTLNSTNSSRTTSQ